ncbi:MAG: formyl transferase [Alphaproteobacteria bacterium]|nr:formyl transferase [Alphaproteobacteria bacterium]
MNNRLLLLGGENPTTWMVYNELMARFGQFPAIIEQPVPRARLVKLRIRKLGLGRALSQIGFVLLVRPVLNRWSALRLRFLRRKLGLEPLPPQSAAIAHVTSVNGSDCHALIARLKPDVVIVNGTRILSRKTLAALGATVINTHQGITPGYRGAHGAYWAKVKNDMEHCGVTIHLVDEGIDTGNIIAQARIAPETEDCFVTYPYLQTAAALEPLGDAVAQALQGRLESKPISGASAVWSHPGFFEYLGHAMQGAR